MQPCDREGAFRGNILEYTVKEFTSGAVSIKYRAELTEIWDGQNEEWIPWADYDMEVWGDCFVVKKDGSLNDAAIKSLVNNAGWDGKFSSLAEQTWKPTPCQFSVKKSEYQGTTYFNAAFVNGFDDTPGGSLAPVDPATAKGLDTRFSAQMRALTGNKMRNQAPPPANAKPPAPPRANAEAVNRELAAAANSKAGDDGIPF